MAEPYVEKDESVESRLTGLLSQDSKYMQQARTGAKQYSESRGLLNSSIAGTAGESAAIEKALPIASQDASQAYGRNLSNQQFGEASTLQSEGSEQKAGLLAQDIAGQSTLQSEGAEQKAGLLAQDIAGQSTLQGEAATQKQELLAADIAGQSTLQSEAAVQSQALANLNNESTQAIAAMNVASFDRDRAMSIAAVMENSYDDMFKTISTAPDIPAAQRELYLEHIAAIRDSSLGLVEQFYNVELDWATPV
jgi:hypothetical protein